MPLPISERVARIVVAECFWRDAVAVVDVGCAENPLQSSALRSSSPSPSSLSHYLDLDGLQIPLFLSDSSLANDPVPDAPVATEDAPLAAEDAPVAAEDALAPEQSVPSVALPAVTLQFEPLFVRSGAMERAVELRLPKHSSSSSYDIEFAQHVRSVVATQGLRDTFDTCDEHGATMIATTVRLLFDPHHRIQLIMALMECAAALGMLDVLKAITRAAIAHHVSVASQNDSSSLVFPQLTARVFAAAAAAGQSAIIEHMCDLGLSGYMTLQGPMAAGNLSIYKLMLARNPALRPTHYQVRDALLNGHADMVLHLLQDPDLRTHEAFRKIRDLSAHFGHLDLLLAAKDLNIGSPLTANAVYQAAANGHLELVIWLLKNTRVATRAASNGHLHVVKWLYANRTEGCSTDAMSLAAANGHIGLYFAFTLVPT
eukprot:jgi/Hompol1/4616/HPOL_000581-RA